MNNSKENLIKDNSNEIEVFLQKEKADKNENERRDQISFDPKADPPKTF